MPKIFDIKKSKNSLLDSVSEEVPFDAEEVARKSIIDIEAIETDRQGWLEKQIIQELLYEAKEDPSNEPIWEGAANYADPTIRTLTKTIYARIHRAVFSVEPFIEVVPIEPDDEPKIEIKRTWINWQTCVNANEGRGAERSIAKWAWSFVKNGTAIVKVMPGRIERYVEEKYPYYVTQQVTDPITGEVSQVQKRRFRTRKGNKVIWEGVNIVNVAKEDFYIAPRYFDENAIDRAPVIAHRTYVSPDYMRRRAEEGVWYSDVVEEILDIHGKKAPVAQLPHQPSDQLKEERDAVTGVNQVQQHGNYEAEEHEILEVYRRWDLNKDGLEEEGIFWIHRASGKLLRWQFLEETYCDGKRPFVAAFYDFKEDQFYVDGVPGELQSTQEELNYLRNQRVNWGTLSSIPSGTYEPSMGANPETIKLEPGKFWPGLKLDVLRLPDNSAFGFREEMLAKSNAKEQVGIGDIQLGTVQPGSTLFRTATGPTSVIQEANIRYAVTIKFFQWALRELFHKIDILTTKMAKPGMVLRVTGQAESSALRLTPENLEALYGKFDFVHRSSADTAFPAVEKEKAMLIMQAGLNPVLIQLGIVTPQNIYEIMKEVYRKTGVDMIERFITKPQGYIQPPMPFERVIGRIAEGIPVKASPMDDFESNLAMAADFITTDIAYGALSPQQVMLLKDWINEEARLQQQAKVAAMMQKIPQIQGQFGQLAQGSPESSGNNFQAAQPPQGG